MGLEPLVPFPGTVSQNWPARCLECGDDSVQPRLNTVVSRFRRWQMGDGGKPNVCKACGDKSRTEALRWNGYRSTKQRLSKIGWMLETPLADYERQKQRLQVTCLGCGFKLEAKGDGLRRPCRCKWIENDLASGWFKPLTLEHPELLSQIHPLKNTEVNVDRLGSGSNQELWWLCPSGTAEFPHEYLRTVQRTVANRGLCPYCSGGCAVPGISDLATYLVQNGGVKTLSEWGPNQPIVTNFATRVKEQATPQKTLAFSNLEANWVCGDCGHQWVAEVSRRSLTLSGCPLCSNRVVVQGVNDLATVGSRLVDQWNYELNDVEPTEVYGKSPELYWWRCPDDPAHLWQASGYNRIVRGSGCPFCADRGYNPGKAGTLYLLKNEYLGAGKFGITNVGTRRLEGFNRQGWEIIFGLTDIDGRIAKLAERAVSNWFRQELGLPAFLSKGDIFNSLAGHTETFDNLKSPPVPEIIARYQEVWRDASITVGQLDSKRK